MAKKVEFSYSNGVDRRLGSGYTEASFEAAGIPFTVVREKRTRHVVHKGCVMFSRDYAASAVIEEFTHRIVQGGFTQERVDKYIADYHTE
jgi:hypothetical protein